MSGVGLGARASMSCGGHVLVVVGGMGYVVCGLVGSTLHLGLLGCGLLVLGCVVQCGAEAASWLTCWFLQCCMVVVPAVDVLGCVGAGALYGQRAPGHRRHVPHHRLAGWLDSFRRRAAWCTSAGERAC
jgi:hypothetical protein